MAVPSIIQRIGVVAIALAMAGCSSQMLSPKRELRGVWVATVANIDWPSSPGLSTLEQKKEIYRLLDYHQMNGINAVVMQVRPSADAFYASKYEPWSQWLSGQQGKGPVPYYDPLTFFIDECHRRGMEFHAWLNPYRAIVNPDQTVTDSLHVTQMVPDWFVRYGDRVYFDPGIPAVRKYFINVTMDIVHRYDVDAIHFDDYFYPYKISGEAFPDSSSYARHGQAFEDIADWRRNNVDLLVHTLSDSIKAAKPWVKFGISPFGVWRNKDKDPMGSATRAGQTNYDDLYADVLTWLREGWIDYVVPQIYWHIGFEPADYEVLLQWWSEHAYGKHVYIGQGAYRIGGENQSAEWRDPSEMPRQLRMNRQAENVRGSVFFSSQSLINNPLGISDSLRNTFYRHKALIPLMPWIDHSLPPPPEQLAARKDFHGILLDWLAVESSPDDPAYYVIYRFKGKQLGDLEDPRNILAIVPASSPFHMDQTARYGKWYTYCITSLDRLYNESRHSNAVTIKRRRNR